ncbi:MAG: alpha-glucosidase [Candidatus Lokiarchaeota archaeon]|nr:alpha-glucosidase [Candidatus Lokiarchaeota archaeon]
MSTPDLCIKVEARKLQLVFKGRILLECTPDAPCIELLHVDPDFHMNPKYVSYYKLKNKVKCRLPLHDARLVDPPASGDDVTIVFDECMQLHARIVNGRLELVPEVVGQPGERATAWNGLAIAFKADATEAIYGCGEQFSFLNLRGRRVPLWTQEPGIVKNHSIAKYIADAAIGAGGEWWTTYYPQPTFVSSANYFVHVESYAYAEFDFREKHRHALLVNEIPKKIVVDVQGSAPAVLASLTSFLGRQRPLPDWALNGAWLGIVGGLDKTDPTSVVAKVDRARAGNVKIAAIWAEDWTGLRSFKAQTRLFWNWKYSQERYPNLPDYIKQLHAEGIKFLGYNNCFLMTDGDLYAEARDRGFLIKNAAGEPYQLAMYSFSAPMLDLTNPGTWAWFKGIIKEHMIGAGLDGWMCDFAEYVPVDAVLHSGQDPLVHHNEYPVLWAKVNAEAIAEAGRDKGEEAIVFFSRSGNAGTTRHSPLIWSGDQIMTFALDMGLAAAICSCISMGFVGVGQTHCDIAGEFRLPWQKRTKDLFMRGTEHAAFTPVMRTHDAKGTSGWTLDSDEETLQHFAKFSRVHATLAPYLKQAIKEYAETGLPVIRHCYLHYEDDPTFHAKKPRSLQYQYLLGRDMLVAPVYTKETTTRKLYLPKDTWVHVWSGKEYAGGWVEVAAPHGEPPVFYRKASPFFKLLGSLKDA